MPGGTHLCRLALVAVAPVALTAVSPVTTREDMSLAALPGYAVLAACSPTGAAVRATATDPAGNTSEVAYNARVA